MSHEINSVPSVSVAGSYASNGQSTKANEFGMRPMQERAFERLANQDAETEAAGKLKKRPSDIHYFLCHEQGQFLT